MRSCNDPAHEEASADREHGTPCLVCGAPILDGIGHDAACMVWTPRLCGNCQKDGRGPCYDRARAAGMTPR